ncbi:MAG: NADPH-dependent assimilatory sulfite reductase hemoprotein subunit [Vulcanimicrobiaceae bacterium]
MDTHENVGVAVGDHLLDLGIGKGNKVEVVKAGSNLLRGTIEQGLVGETPTLSENDVQLLKFHGSYQQEDRDKRKERRADGDTKAYQFMVRTRVPGGILTSGQYLAEDTLAEKYGNHTLRVTTRQGFQLHGILKGDLRAAIAEINAVELTTLAACGDVNRNVMTCPAVPKTPAEQQIQDTADKIARHLAPRTSAYHEIWIDGERIHDAAESEPIYGPSYLPRKFKVGVARPDDNCVDIFTQDIGLVADVEGDDLTGFTVLVGGGMGMTHGKKETYSRLATPLCFVPPSQVLPIVEAIVTAYRDWGDRTNRKHARLKYLVEERGIGFMRSEVQARSGLLLRAPRQVLLDHVDDHLGWQQQADDRWSLGLYVENGRIKDGERMQLRTALRDAVSRLHLGVRLTGQQNVLLTDLARDDIPILTWLLESRGVTVDPAKLGTRRDAMACPALPTCGLALTDAERILPAIVDDIAAELQHLGIGDRRMSIRMTGCPNGCARPYMGDIGFVGRSKYLYDIFLGGDMSNTRLNSLFVPAVRLAELTATIAPLLRRWRDEGHVAEGFGDFCHRLGKDALLPAEIAS